MWFVFGVEGLQGLCQMEEASYLLEADDCDDGIAVIGMMMGIDGKKRRHWFLLIIILYSHIKVSNALLSPGHACFAITSST